MVFCNHYVAIYRKIIVAYSVSSAVLNQICHLCIVALKDHNMRDIYAVGGRSENICARRFGKYNSSSA